MSFAVIIPSKTSDNLSACVRAVRAAGEVCEIVVVSDFDHTGAARDALEGCPGVGSLCKVACVLAGAKPFIFARNINIGIRDALQDQNCTGVTLLNDDALLESPGGFSLLAREAEAHPEFGIIGVTTNLTGQPLQRRRQHMPGLPLQWPVVGLREVPHIAFVGVYIPRRTLDAVGLLDERYCIDYGVDDRDYCEAVTRAGLKVGVHDGCYVDHGSLVSSFRGDPKTPKSFAKNLALFEAKCRHCDRTGERFTASAGMAVAV